ncbi:hypothetical protein JOQ06_027998 [Pogonophryne albipinna]|uniref:Uncharacterized protein n=1 Tax=Pogonophryne albipinna TaxID=1090488 RepID=A0AAD6A8A7_9TELE|nr:hypothetical protein JOQ06_027998 [Pogonophryne albipinna]
MFLMSPAAETAITPRGCFQSPGPVPLAAQREAECTVHCVTVCYPWLHAQALCVVFCPCSLLVGRGRMRSHPSPANSHQSGPMLEPQREEAIAHSTGAHSPSTQGGQGHLTHQGPVYFSCYHGEVQLSKHDDTLSDCRSKRDECPCEIHSIRTEARLCIHGKGEAFQQNYTSFV